MQQFAPFLPLFVTIKEINLTLESTMKNFSKSAVILLSVSLLFTAGCGPKSLTPPADKAEGTSINDGSSPLYGNSGGFSEENLPLEGSLDDALTNSSNGAYGFPEGFDPNAQSDTYKKTHGRCTPGMDPIYFQFDQARISRDMLLVAEKNATFLQENPAAFVTLEGNSDQRGTNEYNMALAERRAINVRDYLVNMGISPDRIRTLSYGEERPLFPEHTEEAYKYNRRVDFVAE